MPVPSSIPSRLAWLAAVIAFTLATAACGSTTTTSPAAPYTGPYDPLVQRLSDQVNVDEALTHMQALQGIADAHGGNRATGSSGYEASVEYVTKAMRAAGFEVSTPTYDTSDGDDGDGDGAPQRNVIAQTRSGDSGRVVMIGAHLDSVPEGPGIVDNGSGVATLLEIARRLSPEPAVRNPVRFAFFADEESGAVGSAGYLASLPAADRETIAMYLNVDMVASPNGGYFVQGGTGRGDETAGPPGSGTIGQVLADRLTRSGVTPEMIEFVGDDESAFIAQGIPVGGAENGDAKSKTDAQAKAWGGQAGRPYDPCYHAACDNLDNVNRELLGHYLPAIAGTVAHFATADPPR